MDNQLCAPRLALGASSRRAVAGADATISRMTTRERLHRLVDELNEAEAEAALVRLGRDHEALRHWAYAEDTEPSQDVWALRNAREAIREEPW